MRCPVFITAEEISYDYPPSPLLYRFFQAEGIRNLSKDVDTLGQEIRAGAPRVFFPHEGPNNIALAMFSFPSLAAYEAYRIAAADPGRQAAMRYYRETGCFLSFERSFMRPVFE